MTTRSKVTRRRRTRKDEASVRSLPAGATESYPIPPPLTAEQREAAIALLRSWREASEEEAEEQRETMQYLRRALNEGRPDELKHFP
jgi:hypothetical protein